MTLIVGLAAVVGIIITWWQKNDADRRAEWWRTTWVFERAFSDDDPAPRRSLAVRRAAARAAVTASKKTGRPVAPDVRRSAEGNDSAT